MKRLAAGFGALFLSLAPAALAEPITHTERLRVGSETVTVGFSSHPLHAERSLDWTFSPESGIAGKKGTITFIQPDGSPDPRFDAMPLPRYTRDRSVWGLDSIALPHEGDWQIEIKLEGIGTGRLPIRLLERPAGPPNGLIWLLASLPVLAVVVMGARAWRQVRPGRQPDANSWA